MATINAVSIYLPDFDWPRLSMFAGLRMATINTVSIYLPDCEWP